MDAPDEAIDEIDDPDVRSVELTGDDGEPIVITQQNTGPGSQVGQGEFPDPDTPPTSPSEAAEAQDELQRDAPIGEVVPPE